MHSLNNNSMLQKIALGIEIGSIKSGSGCRLTFKTSVSPFGLGDA